MGILGSIGKILGGAAKVASFVPGVGTLAGAGLGAAGGLLSGKGVKGALSGAVQGAAGPLAGKLLGGAGAAAGLGKLTAKGIGGALLNNAPTILGIGSGIASGIAGSKKGKQADQYRQKQAAYADSRVEAGAPFRARLAALANRPQAVREDLSGLTADAGNPYARSAPRPTLASMAAPITPQPMRPPVSFGGGGMGPGGLEDDPMGGGGMLSRMARRPMMGGYR